MRHLHSVLKFAAAFACFLIAAWFIRAAGEGISELPALCLAVLAGMLGLWALADGVYD